MVTDNWKPYRLDELGFVGRGKSRHRPRNDARLYGGPYPFIQTADIMAADPYISNYSQTYSEFGLQQSKMWPPETLCMTIAGANTAKTAILKVEACFPDSVIGFIPDQEKSDIFFVKYSLDMMRNRYLSVSRGATQDNLSLDKLLSFPIPAPDVEKQRRIGAILSAFDDLIENSQRRIKILESMARALYREWFVHFRFPGHESVPRVPSPLGEIPKGWEVKTLEALCVRITDGAHHSPPSTDEGYPMASVKDMHDWGINVDNCRRIRVTDYELLSRNNCKPLKNDVLIAKDGSYLKHTFVVGEEQDLVILSSIAILRPNSTIQPNYLSFTLRDPTTKARMTGFVSGVAIPRIVLKDFRNFLILVPPLDIQDAWARHVDPEVEMCRNLVSKTKTLRRTRDLLLPRLLSGQIDVEAIAS